MNHQLAIFMPMTPRIPLALIAVRLAVNNSTGAVSNNVAYTPLALVFRHIRAINSELTQTISYINKFGDSVVIAPRIYLTLQWAEKLQSIVNPHLSFTQQMQLNNALPQNFGSYQKQHLLKNFEQLTFRKQTLSPHTLTLDNQMLSSVAEKNSKTETGLFSQQYPGDNHALSMLASIVARRYLMSCIRINEHSNRVTQTETLPAITLIDNLKYKNFNQDYKVFTRAETESMPAKFNLLHSVHSDVVEFTRHWKTAQSIISLLIQRQQKTVNKLTSFLQFRKQIGMLLSVGNNSLSRRITTSSMTLSRHSYSQSINNRLITTNTSYFLKKSGGLFTQSVPRHYQQAPSADAVDTMDYTKPTTVISNASDNIRSLNKRLQQKNQTVQRQENRNYQRPLAQAEVVYRTVKAPDTTPSVAVPIEPAPIPVAAPQIDIDRLSTDVWRQLEKRIRIERERHGRL